MHSRVEIAVDAVSDGGTRFTKLAADGGLAVRQTSPCGVHLIGTAAGPIGDDIIEISITVGRGAHLQVQGVAATICLPGAQNETSELRLTIQLHEDAILDCVMPPLIVCRGSHIKSTTGVAATSTSTLKLDENVSLGRSGEAAGSWSNRTLADVQGRPALRQTQTSESVLEAISRVTGRRAVSGAYMSRLEIGAPDGRNRTTSAGGAISLDLAMPGRLVTSVGLDMLAANREFLSLRLPADGQDG